MARDGFGGAAETAQAVRAAAEAAGEAAARLGALETVRVVKEVGAEAAAARLRKEEEERAAAAAPPSPAPAPAPASDALSAAAAAAPVSASGPAGPSASSSASSAASSAASTALAAPAPAPEAPLRGYGGRGLRVLSLDGGGIRGLLMIEALAKLSGDCGRKVHELFDLIGGTSTGGMLALALAAHRSLEDVALQYHDLRLQYEGQSAVWSEVRRFTVGASHSTERAEAALKGFFGDVRFADLPRSPKVFVTCANVDSFPAQPYLFRSYELSADARRRTHFVGTSQVSLFEAARATTSAPTFYQPAVIGGKRFVDGAVVANNPSLLALCEAAALWPGVPVETFVSLGTGTVSARQGVDGGVSPLMLLQGLDSASSVLTWARHMFESTMSCEAEHRIAGSLLGHPQGRYFRIDPEGLGDYSISEVNIDEIGRMLEAGKENIRRNEHVFAAIAKSLGCGPRAPRARKHLRPAGGAAGAAATGAATAAAAGTVGASER
jgi:calcium-independent phospholipase A2-gamma